MQRFPFFILLLSCFLSVSAFPARQTIKVLNFPKGNSTPKFSHKIVFKTPADFQTKFKQNSSGKALNLICPQCQGRGFVFCIFCHGIGKNSSEVRCLNCHGRGSKECPICKGTRINQK